MDGTWSRTTSHPCIQVIPLTAVKIPCRSPPAQPWPWGNPMYRAASNWPAATPTHPTCRSQWRQNTQEEHKTTFLAPGSLWKGIRLMSTIMLVHITISFSLNGNKHTIHWLSLKSKKKTHLSCHPQAVNHKLCQGVKGCWHSNLGADAVRLRTKRLELGDNLGTAPEAGANRPSKCVQQGGRLLGDWLWSGTATAALHAVHRGHIATYPLITMHWDKKACMFKYCCTRCRILWGHHQTETG